MSVARRRIDLQTDARAKRQLHGAVAGARADAPGAYTLRADGAGLAHRLEIPVERGGRAGEARIEHVAALAARPVEIACVLAPVACVVGRQLVGPEHVPLDAQRVEAQAGIRVIVERMVVAVLDRPAQQADEAPVARLPVGPDRVEGLTHVRPVA